MCMSVFEFQRITKYSFTTRMFHQCHLFRRSADLNWFYESVVCLCLINSLFDLLLWWKSFAISLSLIFFESFDLSLSLLFCLAFFCFHSLSLYLSFALWSNSLRHIWFMVYVMLTMIFIRSLSFSLSLCFSLSICLYVYFCWCCWTLYHFHLNCLFQILFHFSFIG